MSGKNLNINDSKTRKSQFHKNAKIYNIEEIDTNEILISKKTAKNSYLNTLLDIMIMMLLDHYLLNFHK